MIFGPTGKLECPGDCGLGGNLIQPTRPKDILLMFIGEAPGKDEVISRAFFVGKAGQETTNYLMRVGIDRKVIYITNVLKCRTNAQNRDPKKAEIEACSPLLMQELLDIQPRYIVTAGRFSTQWVLGPVDMEQVHGIPFTIEEVYVTGIPSPLARPTVVIPVYHPALGLHDSANMSLIMADFQAVKDAISGKIMPRKVSDTPPSYEYAVWEGGKTDLGNIISLDTETQDEENTPWSVQFSSKPGTAFFVKHSSTDLLSRINSHVNQPQVITVLHNALFDLPVLADMGIFPAQYVDTMVMAYLLQTEPQGLKQLAFRHLGIKMQTYQEVTNPETINMTLSYLLQVLEFEWPDPDPVFTHVGDSLKIRKPQRMETKVKRILTDYGKDSEVDLLGRWNLIEEEEGRGMVESCFGPPGRAFLKDIPFPQALKYACQDADVTPQIYPILLEKIKALGLEGVLGRDMRMLPMVADMQRGGMKLDAPRMRSVSADFGKEMDHLHQKIRVLAGLEDFNPGSDPQVFQLLRRLGIEKRKEPYRGATDHARLESFASRYPVIEHISQWRGYRKLRSSFLDVLPEKAGKDGRVRTTLRITRVVTGRLSSSNPNLMAQPIRTEDGRKIRGGFVSEQGFSLVSGDYSQIEMRVVAHLSQDPTMMEIFWGEEDIHSETAMRMFSLLAGELDEMKHRYPAKRVGFGILNLISARALLRELEVGGATGWTEASCQQMIYDWFSVYGGVADWIEEQKGYARRYGLVRDMWGRIRLVPELMSVHRAVVEAGIRQAVNAPIQSGAQGVIKEAMGQLVPLYREFGGGIRPLLQVHDDLLFEVRDDLVSLVIPLIKDVMENAAPFMTVPLTVDCKVGKRWNEMKKWN